MSLLRFLTLSESSKTNKVVPGLRDVTLKANVHISDDTLLEYQHDLRTNSTYFNIKLTLDPANSEISAFQQYFIVNGLCDEIMLELDYDNSIIASAEEAEEKEALLVEYAENICNERISRELDVAEKILNSDVSDFFACIEEKVDSLLNGEIDPECIETGSLPLTVKNSNIYLEWFSLIEPCIKGMVEAAGFDENDFPIDNSFELVDLEKSKTLGSLFGYIYEGASSWTPYVVQIRKYHVGSVRVCPDTSFSEEQIKKCLAHCAASFFMNVSKSPIGRRFQDISAELQPKYISLAKEHYAMAESKRREQKIASAKQAHKYASIVIDELGPDAERLDLAIKQNLHFLAIYYDTLTNHIKNEIEVSLNRGLSKLLGCSNVDSCSSVNIVVAGTGRVLRHGEIGETNSPELLSLRISQIVIDYFNEHPWLTKLNIKVPQVEILAEYEAGQNESAAKPVDELVLIKDFFYGDLVPKHSEIIIDVNEIEFEYKQDNEPIPIQKG